MSAASVRGRAQRGTARERDVRRKLEAEGWFVVRAAGSHGVCDLVALRRDAMLTSAMLDERNGEQRTRADARLVSVKSNTRSPWNDFGPAERQALKDAAARAGAEPVLAWWPPHGPLQYLTPAEWPDERHRENREQARQLRADGLTFQAIADKLGVSRQRAHQLVNGRAGK